MKNLLIISLLYFLMPSFLYAETVTIDHYCSFDGGKLPKKIATYTSKGAAFTSNSEAIETLNGIMDYTGLPAKFNIRAANVPNASAVIIKGIRYIFYNNNFMERIKHRTKNNWSEVSILAHEIGHHLSSHTLDNLGSRPPIELEADRFSGYVLQKMGATLSDAIITMKTLSSQQGSSTHPGRDARVSAITAGWKLAEYQGRPRQIKENLTFHDKLNKHISSGKLFTVTFYQDTSEGGCGIDSGTGHLGNLMAGKSYKIYYLPVTNRWITEGSLQANADCRNYISSEDGNVLNFDPYKSEINIWVGIFKFDKKGYLYYGGKKVGYINNPFI